MLSSGRRWVHDRTGDGQGRFYFVQHEECESYGAAATLSQSGHFGDVQATETHSMKNGIYETTFTTHLGTFGTAAVLVKDGAFVGADDMQFFRGEIDYTDDGMRVIMEITRHNFSRESAFGSATVFTLTWTGTESGDSTFRLSCQPKDVQLKLYVTGKLLLATM